MSKTISVNIPTGRAPMNQPNPLEARLRELTAENQEQADLIEAQERLLTTYEAEMDRQSERLMKCLWVILALAILLIVAVATR